VGTTGQRIVTAVETAERPPEVDPDSTRDSGPPPRWWRSSYDRLRSVGRGRHGGRPGDREPLPTVPAVVRWALLSVSLLAVWVLLFAFVLSGLQESRSQATYYATLREGLAGETAPIGAPIEQGSPVFLMTAPKGGLDKTVVVEGTSSSNLTAGPGHLASTVLPGQPGVSVVFGRSVTFGAPFKDITRMKPGDTITVTTGQGTFSYTVDRVRHPGDPLPPPLTQGASRLTLVTAAGAGWRTGWAPSGSVFVDATMHGQTQPVPPGRPAGVPESQDPMQGDTSSLVVLVLWLQLVILVGAFAGWGRSRWGTWQTWLIAAPVMLAALWGATQSAFVLLPNLI
jgi:sortase A